MAEMSARERHIAEIRAAQAELERSAQGTPHRRDTQRRLNRLIKELMIYDRYQGRVSLWRAGQKLSTILNSLLT